MVSSMESISMHLISAVTLPVVACITLVTMTKALIMAMQAIISVVIILISPLVKGMMMGGI
jgi:hypothetical protein